MKKIIKEPLLHFLLIGAAFFLFYNWVDDGGSTENTIVIDESDLDEIVSKFDMQWNRNPTQEELTAIVEKQIEEEVFYQEALKMNLDHNDEIIKRRLAQKMQFLANDISSVVEPNETQLRAYYNAHLERYVNEASYTLFHVFFSPDTRNDFKGDAVEVRSELAGLSIDEALKMGDDIALPQAFENTSEFHISRQMGDEFTQAISKLETGSWQGPINSGYGAHLVYIEHRIDAQPALFEDVEKKVRDDYNYDYEKEVKASIFKEFVKSYSIEFDVKDEFYTSEFVSKMRTQISGE